MKTQLSSLDISFLVRELKELVGARIDKVFQIGERDIKIDLRATEKKELIITPAYMCLTKFKYKTPKTPSNFSMVMRKNLSGAVIRGVKQHHFDRIIEFDLGEKGRLIIELFSRGNIIFVENNNLIKVILEGQEWKDRTLRVGLEYFYPPQMPNVKELSLSDFVTLLADKKEIVKVLAGNIGLGATYANELLSRIGVDPKTLVEKDTVEKLFVGMGKLLDSKIDANIVIETMEEDVVPFKMELYKNHKIVEKNSFNEAIDEYFTKIRDSGQKKEATRDFREEVERVQRLIEKQEKTATQLKESIEKFKGKGDFIYSHFQEIEGILEEIKKAKTNGKNWFEYLQEAGFNIPEPEERKFDYHGVGLFIDKSVTKNAGYYYDKSKKSKSKFAGALDALRHSKRELAEVSEDQVRAEKKIPVGPQEKHKPEWYEKFRWFTSSDGFLVLGGRDATTNEILIKKHLEDNDLVFHSTVHGAPFFIVKNPDGKEISDSTKQETAEAAASYSSAWGAGWGSADIYAVKPEQISKTAQSGEYLSKGAFVIRGEREWFKGTPLKIALGFKIFDKYAIVIGGPEGAVASQAKHYVRIGVGAMKSGQIAKEVKAAIQRQTNKEDGQKIKKVILGEMQKWIPAGKGMILK